MATHIKRALAFHVSFSETEPQPSLEWMPAGRHEIQASVNGKPTRITVNVSESLIPILNEQLTRRLSQAEARQASRPFTDFDHEGKAASAIPKRFYWDNGIRCEVEWTQAGRNALSGGDYSYFSPEFLIDAKSGAIRGIPEFGPIGALVNTPAFQTIERVSAQHQTPNKKMEPIMTVLVAAGLASSLDPEKINSQELKQRLESLMQSEKDLGTAQAQLTQITGERDQLQTQAKATLQSAATVSVEAAITAGKINKDAKDHWVQAFLSDPDRTQAMIQNLPGKPVQASGRAPVGGGHQDGKPETLAVSAGAAWGKQFTGFRNN